MILVAPNPILFSIGPLSIRYYGLVYALGFLAIYWYLSQLSKQKRIKLSIDQIETFLIYSILGTVIGGRVGEFIFYQTSTLLSNPLQIFKIWQGGMSFHGAIIGIIITTTLFCRKNNIKFYTLIDHLVLPGSLILVFGRITNFMNAELIGRVTDVSWCVNWYNERTVNGELICRHPSQLYEAFKNFFIFGTLYFLPLFLIFGLQDISNVAFSIDKFVPIIKLAIFASSLAFVLYAYGLKEVGASRTSIFSNIIPSGAFATSSSVARKGLIHA